MRELFQLNLKNTVQTTVHTSILPAILSIYFTFDTLLSELTIRNIAMTISLHSNLSNFSKKNVHMNEPLLKTGLENGHGLLSYGSHDFFLLNNTYAFV